MKSDAILTCNRIEDFMLRLQFINHRIIDLGQLILLTKNYSKNLPYPDLIKHRLPYLLWIHTLALKKLQFYRLLIQAVQRQSFMNTLRL